MQNGFTPKADIDRQYRHVRFVPTADINDMSGAAATAGERGVSLSACVLQRWRHSTGSHCRSHDCLPKYCLCGAGHRQPPLRLLRHFPGVSCHFQTRE